MNHVVFTILANPIQGRRHRWGLSVLLGMLGVLQAGAAPSLTLDHGAYLPGETIVAYFSGGPGNPTDWVGLYQEGQVPGGPLSTRWYYVNNTQNATVGTTEGTIRFEDGLQLAGDWVAFFLANDQYDQLAQVKFKVIDPSEPYVRTSKPTYAPGEAITVGFTNGPANPKDWIAIYPAGKQPDNTYLLWLYVDGTTTGSTGKSEGEVTLSAGLNNPGAYEAFLLLNDGYTVLASEPFQVVSSAFPRFLSVKPANGASNLPPVIEFSATVTNGTTKLVPGSVALEIDSGAVPFQLQEQPGLTIIGYTNQTLVPANSTHTYRATFRDDATPANTYTNQGTFTIGDYRNIVLPAPLYFENFDATPEGQLPAGWTSVSFVTIDDENVDLQDLYSKPYANWLVVDRARFTNDFLTYADHTPTDDYQRVLSPNRLNVVNGQIYPDMISGRFAFGNSGYRDASGSQYLILYSPDFDLTGKTNVYLSFHSIWEQNQDSIGTVEYSVDRGQTWLPIVYLLDGPDVVSDEAGNVDAVATFTTDRGDVAHYTDPVTGEDRGGTYGAFIGAPITAELAPYISPRVDNDPVGSKRVELFRLDRADNQAAVRFRFAHAGTDSWYFGVDDFGLYSIGPTSEERPSLQVTRSGQEMVISWDASVTGFTLETTPTLTQPTWTEVPGVANNSVRVATGTGTAFYRLRR